MKVCLNCGAENRNDASFCFSCGKTLLPRRPSMYREAAEPEQSSAERQNLIRENFAIAGNSWKTMRLREIAVRELARLGARRELMKIANNTWLSDSLRKLAMEMLESMQ